MMATWILIAFSCFVCYFVFFVFFWGGGGGGAALQTVLVTAGQRPHMTIAGDVDVDEVWVACLQGILAESLPFQDLRVRVDLESLEVHDTHEPMITVLITLF